MSTIFRDLVKVGTFQFNDRSWINGAQYNIDLLDGWNDTADLNVETANFANSDGVVYSERFTKSAKFIEVGGYVLTTDRAAAELAMQNLPQIFTSGELQVTRYSGRPRSAIAVRTQRIAITEDVAEQGFRWQTQLMMPWPFKTSPNVTVLNAGTFAGADYYRIYDPATYDRMYTDAIENYRTYSIDNSVSSNSYGFPDSVVVVNNGNATAYPTITINGPLDAGSWAVTNEASGDSLYFGMDISTGSSLVLDTLHRSAKLDGIPVDYFIGGEWLTVPPGSSTIRLYVGADNPTASIQISTSDTWEG